MRGSFFTGSVVLYVLGLLLIVVGPDAGQASADDAGGRAIQQLQSSDAIGYLLLLGEEALGAERYGHAIRLFSEVLRHDWNYPRAFDLLQKARSDRTEALASWERRGRWARSQGDWPGALGYFERVRAEDTTRTDIDWLIADVRKSIAGDRLIRAGLERYAEDDFAGAHEIFAEATALVPKDSVAAHYLAVTETRLARSASFAELRGDSTSWAQYRTALLKFRAGEFEAARVIWNDLLTLYPGNEDVRANLDQTLRRINQEPVAKLGD